MIIGIGIYAAVVALVYTVLFLTFTAMVRADKATPAFGAVFFYGGPILIDTIPLVITICCGMRTYRDLRETRRGMKTTIALTILATVAAWAISFYITAGFFMLVADLLNRLFTASH